MGSRENGKRASRLFGYLYATLTCAAITLFATPLRHYFDLANIVMLFLLGVVFIAYQFGRGPAALAAVLSVASYDFFFVPPRLTFAVADVQYLVTFPVMLIVGLVTGHLTAGLRYQARVARYREERARSLSEMAKSLSSALVETQVVEISDKFVESSFSAKAAILLPDLSDKLDVPAAHGASRPTTWRWRSGATTRTNRPEPAPTHCRQTRSSTCRSRRPCECVGCWWSSRAKRACS